MAGTGEVSLFNPVSCPTRSVLNHFTDGEIEAQHGEPLTRSLSLQLFAVGWLRPWGSMASQGAPLRGRRGVRGPRRSWGDAGPLDIRSPRSPSPSVLPCPMSLLSGAELRGGREALTDRESWARPAGSALLIEMSCGSSRPTTPAASLPAAADGFIDQLACSTGNMTGQRGAGMERVPGLPTAPCRASPHLGPRGLHPGTGGLPQAPAGERPLGRAQGEGGWGWAGRPGKERAGRGEPGAGGGWGASVRPGRAVP